ncbi:nitroreductase family protein [Trinickia dabaoshanensis]|uniref:Nitroreductase family protein n=1 Tax=Trinickia dabaoshanensis TaxID=564714 RepID=A0A2N7VGD1_9BURK|nr:nitroreductase family protein [Trinickia dabaoshanensis]PMS16206.1 nitroreductase family protein [Trinickia dabaoshanensis]
MINPTVALIEQRISTNLFDTSHRLDDTEIEELVRLATRAPTAYNLQNWRFIAVRDAASKATLRELSFGQQKVSNAAVTFIVCGVLPRSEGIPERLRLFVEAGHMRPEMSSAWQEGAQAKYADPQAARDEAIRSASLGAATLIYAAQALGLASGPMNGFDADAVAKAFELAHDEVPVMLVAVGRAAPGNWPQKPRRALSEVLRII